MICLAWQWVHGPASVCKYSGFNNLQVQGCKFLGSFRYRKSANFLGVQHCCGYEIQCFFYPWIWDPGWVISQDPDLGSGSWMNNPDNFSGSLETIFWVKINTLILWCGSGRMEKIWIQDKHPVSATLGCSLQIVNPQDFMNNLQITNPQISRKYCTTLSQTVLKIVSWKRAYLCCTNLNKSSIIVLYL